MIFNFNQPTDNKRIARYFQYDMKPDINITKKLLQQKPHGQT